jgi:hypothetical protein
MYKKRLLFSILLLKAVCMQAQISMTLQVPPAGVLVKNQLWNMLLVNSGNSTVNARISLVLLDEKTNQPVLTASTAPVILPRGAKQLQARDLSPITYNYNGPAYQGDRDPNGMLPVGTYQACYTVVNGIKDVRMVENCIQLNVDPLSPPMLNTPADQGNIYTPYPQFTWLPPTPLGIFNDLSYALVLVEVLPGQGKADAIQQNIPVYSGGFITDLFLNYPSSYRALDTAKLYAWRIVALNNGTPAAMTDIWTFRVVTPPKPTPPAPKNTFVELGRGLSPSVSSSSETLMVAYENSPADTAVNYTITCVDDPRNPTLQQGKLSLTRGANFLLIPLQRGAGWATRKVYLFQFTNSRKENWTLKFTWSSDNKSATH